MTQTLASNRRNQPLDIGRLSGGSWCGKHLLDAHVLQLPLNIFAIDSVSIPEYVLRNGVIRKGLKKKLRGPFCGWMRRNVEVSYAATLMSENLSFAKTRADGFVGDCVA